MESSERLTPEALRDTFPIGNCREPEDRTYTEPSASAASTRSERFYSVDALRTVAALAVVLAHWPQHFFSFGRFAQPPTAAPFYRWLSVFYMYGPSAVTFFYCLSGFIFFWLYADAVHAGRMSFRRYSLLRASRLYPLHIVTLAALLPLTLIGHSLYASDFVYHNGDLFHFVLNMGFAQHWGFEKGLSWNGPSWSLSVEIALYFVFFWTCRTLRPTALATLGVWAGAFMLAPLSDIGQGAAAFYTGGLTYFGYLAALRHRHAVRLVAALTLAVAASWPVLSQEHMISRGASLIRDAAQGTSGAVAANIVANFIGDMKFLAPFAFLILAAVLIERATPAFRWRRLAGVGNLSFGVYLIHFPLQLLFVCAAAWFSSPDDVFARGPTFVGFFAALLITAAASYRWLERPALQVLRRVGS
jgi:peptidoglycan/LPS O-acetylase OafA/YrhL